MKQLDVDLHRACEKNNIRLCKELIIKGANVNSIGLFGRRPIHYPCHRKFTTICKLLIANGADVNEKDGCGNTPFISLTSIVANPVK